MTALWFTLTALLVIAIAIVFLPLIIKRKTVVTATPSQQNVAVFKDRLQELENEKSQGALDESSFLHLKTELEKSLLADVDNSAELTVAPIAVTKKHWLIGAAMAFFVVLVSLAMYADLGRSEDYGNYLTLQAQAKEEAKTNAKNQATLQKLLALLKAKLKQDPRDVEKWFLLANSYAAMGQYPQAAQVFLASLQYIEKSDPRYAQAKGSYAQMLFQAAGEKMTPEVVQAMQETLAIDPMESSALILSGINAYTQGDVRQAIDFWEKSKVKADENLIATFIEPIIMQARTQLGVATAQSQQPQAGASAARLTIQLDISPALKAKVSPDLSVFVFARPVGGRMPLAAQKLLVKDLPTTVVLDDSKSPMPTARLSSVTEVDLTARVSLSGQPTPNKGDLFVTLEKVKVSHNDKLIELQINQEVK